MIAHATLGSFYHRNRSAIVRLAPSGSAALFFVLLAVFGPLITGHIEGQLSERLLGVLEQGHLLGTDGLGRDELALLIAGSRPSMIMGIVPVLVAGFVGSAIGILTGLAAPIPNKIAMRFLDVFYAFPPVLLAIAIAAPLGGSKWSIVISLSIVLIPPVTRVAEGETRLIARQDYMESARASGAGAIAIAFRQAWPATKGTIIVFGTTLIGLSLIFAGGLSYLGLGVSPPTPEWGLMVAMQQDYIYGHPLLAIAPALAILLAAFTFNTLGNALHEVFNAHVN